MTRITRTALAIAAAMLCLPGAAHASDEAFEFWLNPSVTYDLNERDSLEFDSYQRFRSASDGRVDTYLFRLWVHHKLADNATLSGAIEQRENDGGLDEVRTTQQLATSHGILRTRLRLEQRWVEDQGRMGLRLRPQLGVSVPLDAEGQWALRSSGELFFTLRAASAGGDKGLTGLRTQLGIKHRVSDHLTLGLDYVRQHDLVDGGPDRVGHAPMVGIEVSF